MFQHARLKLTAWYLAIIMLISIIFSLGFYNLSTREIQRFMRLQEERQKAREQLFFPFKPPERPLPPIEALEESKNRIKISLISLNVLIFILAGSGGYFLAGRTLKPIKDMVDDQARFISDASHELRTPLTALRAEMEATLLAKHLSEREAKTVLKSNLEEVINLQTLSDELLELTGLKNGNGNNTTEFSLLQIIEDALKKIIPLAKLKSLTINNEVDDLQIKGNEQRLTRLFIILLENAVKYNLEKKNIYLTSSKIDHTVEVQIKDEGMGIDRADLPFIFDRFYRSDKSRTKNDIPGYGLGLAIAKKIIVEHHGSIDIKSYKGKGTTVIIKIPAA